MRIQQAIEKAIEGGWEGVNPKSHFALEPLFWQSLGKAMGWTDNEKVKIWKYNWHDFIDHLAEGKTVEEFFDEIEKI